MGFGSFPTFSIDEKVGKKSRPVGCPLNWEGHLSMRQRIISQFNFNSMVPA
ncbi:hypothetical protein Echvi_3507 [Echinicola vietnamensis DSM 17526]|uniref:Uncharacterized protein n=1 Tax=Echinicola vietnamensis (strain DSM 17526 / LMG 23754 / KMM 6221) TaxID=926556 RepID=L0G342_ECHVK|nr:hypothetical protein Echvi_3507 [Echinicola vietnamensis DSM 17526]